MLVGLGVALACSGSVEDGDKDTGDAATDQGPGGSGGVYGPPPPEDAGQDAGEDALPEPAYGPPPPLDGGEEDAEQDAEQDAPDEAMSGAYGPPPDSGS